jgi:hypothetical protein
VLDRDLAATAGDPNASTFFPNLGTESEATVLKFARSATDRAEFLIATMHSARRITAIRPPSGSDV